MSVGQVKGNWYAKWYEGKEEVRVYFGHGELAERQARRKDEEIKRSKGKIKELSGLTITAICQEYHRNHPVQASTASTDYYRLSSVLLPVLGHIQADLLTTQELNDYILGRIKEGRKSRTIDRELDILRSAFAWAMRQTPPLLVRNVVASFRYKPAADSEIPMPPTRDEMQRIISHSPQHLIRALILEWYLGVRPGGEVSRIRWSDVDMESWKIRVLSARKGGPVIRYVPVKEGAFRGYLEGWAKQDEAGQPSHVVHWHGRPVVSVKRSWGTAKRKAGILRKLRLYDIRHAMATYALEAGADLKALSQIFGHSRPETLMQHYQHVLDNMRRDAVSHVPDLNILSYPKPRIAEKRT